MERGFLSVTERERSQAEEKMHVHCTRFPLRSECFYKRKEEGHSRLRDIQPLEKDGKKSTMGKKLCLVDILPCAKQKFKRGIFCDPTRIRDP